jgi:hypothetical protein
MCCNSFLFILLSCQIIHNFLATLANYSIIHSTNKSAIFALAGVGLVGSLHPVCQFQINTTNLLIGPFGLRSGPFGMRICVPFKLRLTCTIWMEIWLWIETWIIWIIETWTILNEFFIWIETWIIWI